MNNEHNEIHELEELFDGMDLNRTERLLKGVEPVKPAREEAQRLRELTGASVKSARSGLHIGRRVAIAIAACVAALIALGVGAYAYAEDAREYKEALVFFEENDLSTEGLTRSEIKKVYRDITTDSYTYSKTAEVLAHRNETHSVEGESFGPENTQLTDDERQAGYDKSYERYLSTARYEFRNDVDNHETDGACTVKFKTSTIIKMVGQTQAWSVTTDKLDAHYAFDTADGVLISGWLPYEYTEEYGQEYDFDSFHTPAVMKLDNSGNFVWVCAVGGDNVSSAVQNADGTYTVFSAENDYSGEQTGKLIVTGIDAEGKLISSVETPSEAHVWVCDVVPCDDGYLGINYVDDYTGTHEQHVVRIDAEGRLTEEFKFGEGSTSYKLFDIKVFGGKLYISANIKGDPYKAYYGDGEWWKKNVPEEEFTEAVKNAYTAVLLVCDATDSEPRLFYEVKGAEGITLTVNEEGRLVWEVHSIYSAAFSPWYGSRPFNANVKIYKYLFTEDGGFAESVDTGEVMPFMG